MPCCFVLVLVLTKVLLSVCLSVFLSGVWLSICVSVCLCVYVVVLAPLSPPGPSRRDDMESLGYALLAACLGRHPWQSRHGHIRRGATDTSTAAALPQPQQERRGSDGNSSSSSSHSSGGGRRAKHKRMLLLRASTSIADLCREAPAAGTCDSVPILHCLLEELLIYELGFVACRLYSVPLAKMTCLICGCNVHCRCVYEVPEARQVAGLPRESELRPAQTNP